MSIHTAAANLEFVLEKGCERISRSKFTVLFRRGDKCFGMFIVLKGKVSLDVGTDSPLARSYGPGALIGLPATLSGLNYSMSATVMEDAELGFWSREELDTLLGARPDLCQQLLAVVAARLAENQAMLKALLRGDKLPFPNSKVV